MAGIGAWRAEAVGHRREEGGPRTSRTALPRAPRCAGDVLLAGVAEPHPADPARRTVGTWTFRPCAAGADRVRRAGGA